MSITICIVTSNPIITKLEHLSGEELPITVIFTTPDPAFSGVTPSVLVYQSRDILHDPHVRYHMKGAAMHIAVISTLSLIFQLAAAVQALRLIKPGIRMTGWVFIAIAAVIQGIRRAETLYRIRTDNTPDISATSEYLGLAISLFFLAGVILIGQLFRELKEAHDAVHENRVKLENINATLATLVREEVVKNREKDIMLLQQSRLATMGEMMRSITHQWRQPLNNLGLILQGLPYCLKLSPADADELKRSVNSSMSIIEFLSHTIDDFRIFFKEERQKSEFRIMNIVRKMELMFSASLQEKNIILHIEGDEEVQVHGYPNEYAHVLLNLINNARDVLVERQTDAPRINIRCFQENGRGVIVVQDNGGGIDTAHLERIFDPDFTTKEHDRGTGIGLYLAKVIVERHMGGTLTVSNVNGGAEFRVGI